MSREDDLLLTGSVAFDAPVPLSSVEAEYSEILRSQLAVPTYAGDGTVPALTGVEFTDPDAWWDCGVWFGILHTLETIARRHSRTLSANASFASDGRGRGHLLVDAGGHFHLCAEGDDAESHRTRMCTSCLHCYPPHADGTFEVAEESENDTVRLSAASAGPFTNFLVHCDDHGEVACPPSHKEALFRREQHLLEQHTPHPLPLGAVAASDVLGQDFLNHIAFAARQLRDARYYVRQEGMGGGAVRPRNEARAAARRALAELPELPPEQLTELLLQLLVEQHAGR
ncbi:hypothetical protein ABT173_11515 [Streptomyces sp. NPDC001795]|uniref:hypothetical protein n=1 Tax=Streptomyces sp. NPDC001795 TaxID=3154525 RepID=UPI00331F031B